MPITRMQEYVELVRRGEGTEQARLELLEDHRRRVLHDLEHLNDCLGAINFKIDHLPKEHRMTIPPTHDRSAAPASPFPPKGSAAWA